MGYSNVYFKKKEYASSLDTLLWLIRYLDSVRVNESTVSYVDKINAVLYAECAALAGMCNKEGQMETYLRKAYTSAKRFDAAPTYGSAGLRFGLGDTAAATAYDNMGETAMDAVERSLNKENTCPETKRIWKEIDHEEV